MPRLIAEHRILDEELRRFLSAPDETGQDRWPSQDRLLRFMREELRLRVSEREYTRLRRFGIADEKVVRGLLLYCLERPPIVLREFAATQSPAVALSDPDAAVEQLSTVWQAQDVGKDLYYQGSWFDLPAMLAAAIVPDNPRCGSPLEADDVYAMIYRAVGEECADKATSATADPKDVAAARMRRTLAEFQGWGRALWKACPWTAARTTINGHLIAVSSALPLSPAAYERVRDGHCSDLEIAADDLQYPSPYLFLVGIASTDDSQVKATRVRISATRMVTHCLQMAQLCIGDSTEVYNGPLHLLTFGGTPKTEGQLRRFGYRPVGKRLGALDLPLYELVVPGRDGHPGQASVAQTLARWVFDQMQRLRANANR